MTTTVKIKSSTVGGNVPSALAVGELAVNLVDKRIFSANSTQIFDIFQNTASNVAISSTTGYLKVGNSTVNSFANSSAFALTVNSSTYFVIKAPTAADYASGTKVLLANGSWGTVSGGSGSPGGTNTNIQFNDSGAFSGSNAFSFDKTTNTVTVVNEVLTGNLTVNSDFISVGNSIVNSVINSVSIRSGNSTVAATLNSTALMFGASSIDTAMASNGYSYMPNGLIYQWGFGVATTGAGATFTFPLAFPTAVFSIQLTPQGRPLANNVFVNAVSTAGFNAITSTASVNVYYTAIGK
jgi:hypothetical protein